MEMLQFDFIQRAFLAGGAISLITPILGLLLILRQQSLLSDTLSHISLAGVAFGLLLRVNPSITTLILVTIASVLIEYLRRYYKDFSDVSIAIMMSSGMALGLILASFSSNAQNFRIDQFLFGSILLISPQEVKLIYALAAIVVGSYIIFRRPLYVLSFDEDTAHTIGLPVGWMSIIFSVVTGIAISLMMPIVGALLVSALIIIPSATAIKVSRSFTQTIVIAFIINLIGIGIGITASYYLNTPPGASITMTFVVAFILVSIFHQLRIVWKRKFN